jgi:hypothetical protein
MVCRVRSAVISACFLSFLTLLAGCAPKSAPVTPVETAAMRFPNVGSILVLVDHLPGNDTFTALRAQQVAIGLRYLTPDTSWEYIDTASPAQTAQASAVVYLGLNGLTPPTPPELAALRAARRLVVSQHHLRELRDTNVAFANTSGGVSTNIGNGATVTYRGMTAPLPADEYLTLNTHAPARILGELAAPHAWHVPYIVADGNALFINAPLAFVVTRDVNGPTIAACDAIAAFLGVAPNTKPLAMLRLEDVSAITPPDRMAAIVDYLDRAHVPYGIGVIPDLRVEHGAGGSLRDAPRLVDVLKTAQTDGATIILHGLHHCCSAQDSEGYEFWDRDTNAPVAGDSTAWMHGMIAQGLNDERALGLDPVMWETPHYSASPADYVAVAQFFRSAWEVRRPVGWLPWPLQRDQYGTVILPENLGYVSLDGVFTVKDQLERARAMLACRYCVAVGFLHPALLNVDVVRAYVEGLRAMGYAFVDPKSISALPSRRSQSRRRRAR